MSKLRAFLKDIGGITGLQVINVYSFALILPKGWIDYCTDEIDFEGKPTRFVRLEVQGDSLIIKGVNKEEIENLLESIKYKGAE